jgi:hypothetical protein
MEADNQAMLKGVAGGVAVPALVGGILWYNFPKKS